MKILLYDNHRNNDEENDRAKAVFMSRDDRVFAMGGLRKKPQYDRLITNDILTNSIIGESEIISGDVLLVVEQCVREFRLPYALIYNKPVRKPEIYIERAIDRAREILEENTDICSDLAFKEFLLRKGMDISSIWIFAALVKSKLIKQICRCMILAQAIKRLVDKEIFIVSDIEIGKNVPSGTYKDDEGIISPPFHKAVIYIIRVRNKIVQKPVNDIILLQIRVITVP
jgi:hypothetical protein